MTDFTLDGLPATIAEDVMLLDYLRETRGMTRTHLGCGIGRCGACTVMLDNAPVNACILMGWQLEGRAVSTIAALPELAAGRALITAMEEANAFQCGYCASGIMMTLAGLLTAEPAADDATIKAALAGNLCRCTGYHSILRGAYAARDLLKDTAR